MNHTDLARFYLGMPGAMISGSKSTYHAKNPGHRIFFNANVAIGGRFVWHGDLDIDDPKTSVLLKRMANEADGDPVHVLPENPYRFEVPSREEILSDKLKDVVRIDP